MAYLPFGDGQRMCLGNRVALMHMKLSTAKILEKFEMTLCAEKHKDEIEIQERAAILIQPKGGVWLKCTKL